MLIKLSAKKYLTSKGKAVFSLIFSFCMCVGRQIDKNWKLSVPGITDILWFVILAVGAYAALWLLETVSNKFTLGKSCQQPGANPHRRRIAVFIFFAIVYSIVLRGVYPGFFVYDAATELMHFIKDNNTTWHPLFHTYIMGKIITFFYGFNENYNQGIFAYLFIQMVIMSLGFTYMNEELVRYRIPKVFRIISCLYMGLFPPVVMYVLCSVTDSFFAFFVLMYTIQLVALFCTPEIFEKERYRFILLTLFALFTMLFRKNGIYDLIVFTPLLVIFTQKKHRAMALATSLVAIVLFIVINNILIVGMRAEKNGQQEAFAVPLQQIARSYNYYPEDFDDEDLAYMASLQDMERWTMYSDKISDGIKEYVDGKEILANPGRFISFWFKHFVKRPVTFFNAWLLTSYEMWYPGAIFDCYSTGQYEEICYFGYVTEEPGWRNLAVSYIDKVYRAISVRAWPHKIPVIRFIWSPGTWLWLSAAAMTIINSRGKRNFTRAFIFLFIVYLTMLLGPASLVRYVAYIFFVAPLVVSGLLFTDSM